MSSAQASLQGVNPQSNLQSDIKEFVCSLPQWGQVIAAVILSGKEVSESDIDKAYQVLLEDLNIFPKTNREKIDINFVNASGIYFKNVKFKELSNTEGINALAEKQVLKFSNGLTIIYGINGAGKSGYIRLFKKVFYSKSREEILPNIHLSQLHKKPAAVFIFETEDGELELKFPADITNPVFSQFSVFDGKAVVSHLDQKNVLEFRPAGLSFFSQYTEAIKRLENKLQEDVKLRQAFNPFPDLFDGDSDIKIIINRLSVNTKMAELKKYLPFTEEDRRNKEKIDKEYDEVYIASKGKDKEMAQLEKIKHLLKEAKINVEKINKYFSDEALKKVSRIINDFVVNDKLAKQEGISRFKTELISGVGSPEWKSFIVAAGTYAGKQKLEAVYPMDGDHCLLCQQPLTIEAKELISSYWIFIKSEAEKVAAEAGMQVQQIKSVFEGINFDLFPEGNVLTVWMKDKQAAELDLLTESLNKLRDLRNQILGDLNSNAIEQRSSVQVNVVIFDNVLNGIDGIIHSFKNDEQLKVLARLLSIKTLYTHREKLQSHISGIESFVDNQNWLSKAGKVNWGKRGVTDAEKELSGKYFNQKYIDTFNEECTSLDGDFGIVVNHTGSAGASYRQLFLKGNSPSTILSEGEQKVIALADFIAEMRMSEINHGMVFDDPVNSLDEHRKTRIAEHLAKLSKDRQIIVFSHDLVFVSALITYCEDSKIEYASHWIEKREDMPGMIFLNNSPSYEKKYRNVTIPMEHYAEAKKDDCLPAQRDYLITAGFTALRTCYEVLVIYDLFKNVVQRFNERVSIDSLSSVYFDQTIVNELMDSFARCCRFMEGHSHSDKYAYKKPDLKDLKDEIELFDSIKKKLKNAQKVAGATM
jgi:hypothetical protein